MKLSPRIQDAKKELAYQHTRQRPTTQNIEMIMGRSFEEGFDSAAFLYEPTIEQLKENIDELKEKYKELTSNLPKVPTQPYEKQLAVDLLESQAREKILLDALECYRWIHAHTLNKDRICYVAKEALEKYNLAKAGSENENNI